MHGYELRKRLNTALGPFRALSYGSLYPALQAACSTAGWIAEAPQATGRLRRAGAPASSTSSPHTGKEQFQELVDRGRAERLGGRRVRRAPRLLRPHRRTRCGCASSRAGGRGSRSELARVREASVRTRERLDAYTRPSSGTARSRPSARSAG